MSYGANEQSIVHNAVAEPVIATVADVVAPVIPADCKMENKLPAGTLPAKEAIHVAAHDPAAIPLVVNPRIGSMAAVPRNAAPPIVARHE